MLIGNRDKHEQNESFAGHLEMATSWGFCSSRPHWPTSCCSSGAARSRVTPCRLPTILWQHCPDTVGVSKLKNSPGLADHRNFLFHWPRWALCPLLRFQTPWSTSSSHFATPNISVVWEWKSGPSKARELRRRLTEELRRPKICHYCYSNWLKKVSKEGMNTIFYISLFSRCWYMII